MRLTSDSVDQFHLGPRERGALAEPLDSILDLTLLQAELSERCDGNVAFRVLLQGLLAELLSPGHVLLPLEDGKRLVHKRQYVARLPAP